MNRKIRLMCLAAGLVLAGQPAAVVAQPYPAAAVHAGELVVPLNKSQVVNSDRVIAKALVGSSEIADVLPLSNRSVYVLGKKVGTTSLTLYDNLNNVIAVLDIAVGPDVDGLRRQLSQFIPDQPIEARITNDSIVLSGTVDDPGKIDRAVQLAKAYAGEKVINLIATGGSQQVMLEVKFAEVTRNLGENLQVSGFGTSSDGTFHAGIGQGASLNSTTGLTLGAISDSFGIFNKVFSVGSLGIDATLAALERKGLAKTLAEPTLIALSGERASFLAGGEFPIPVAQTGSAGGTGNTAIAIEFKPFGVSLGFTPTVLADKVVNLVIEPEVSSIDPSASVTVNGLVVPGLQTRRASTTVELRDGESFAIAGLLRQDFKTTVRQLPLLGSIPIIGSLFRSSGFEKGQTELLIVVTPHLVAPLKPGQVRLPTDRVGDPKPEDVLIDGEGYHPQPLPKAPPAPPAHQGADAAGVTGPVGPTELPAAPAAGQPQQQKVAGYAL